MGEKCDVPIAWSREMRMHHLVLIEKRGGIVLNSVHTGRTGSSGSVNPKDGCDVSCH